ncbi:MAG: NAD(P)H-dependent oxidoreductase [bacterium]|nr:NAD(P)H-dependent oxidoreductase [bacterium]
MNITIINGTNRIGNRTIDISTEVVKTAVRLNHTASIVTLDNFDMLFRGEKITHENSAPNQEMDMKAMIHSQIHLYVVPTYHTGIPSSLKNFFDILKCDEAFEGKIIGVISSNNHGRDYGARQAVQTITGILSYGKLQSFLVPIIPIIDFDDIDTQRIEVYLRYCENFATKWFGK